jgi:hypothetical protein
MSLVSEFNIRNSSGRFTGAVSYRVGMLETLDLAQVFK